eukprot:scaffold7292_cov132-Isochrysis_galbana.AAC.2
MRTMRLIGLPSRPEARAFSGVCGAGALVAFWMPGLVLFMSHAIHTTRSRRSYPRVPLEASSASCPNPEKVPLFPRVTAIHSHPEPPQPVHVNVLRPGVPPSVSSVPIFRSSGSPNATPRFRACHKSGASGLPSRVATRR